MIITCKQSSFISLTFSKKKKKFYFTYAHKIFNPSDDEVILLIQGSNMDTSFLTFSIINGSFDIKIKKIKMNT